MLTPRILHFISRSKLQAFKCLIYLRISPLQLFLHFSVGSAPPAGVEMDIIMEETCTVKEVKRSLCYQTLERDYICVFICTFSLF